MPKIQPYIIIPKLIPQPTWGGDYIASLKKLSTTEKIGQSYELYEESQLENNSQPIPIRELIKQTIPLVKLTQAKGNSYQIHTPKKIPGVKWLPKPESWYYLEPGLISLGVKGNWDAYKKNCLAIDIKAKELVASQPVSKARQQLQQFIHTHNPIKFVNLVQVGRGQAIDLSAGGLHHSWEEDEQKYPQGNMVYEVQKNVYDDQSTIRCFDQGKITDDGKIRQLDIDDYFKYIDRSPQANDPKNHFRSGKILKKSSLQTIKEIFTTPNYSLQLIKFRNQLANKYTQTTDSFHHLFVSEGNLQLLWQKSTWTVTRGCSIVIPAPCGTYELRTHKCYQATVLKTYV